MRKKSKIAISINNQILEYLDKIIDKERIKNRSQAIEYMVEKSMRTNEVRDAVVFLYKYDLIYFQYIYEGEQFLQQLINFLTEGGITRIFILSQHPKNILEPQLKNVDFKEIDVIIKYFPDELYNLPMLYKIRNELKDNFLVTNGDSLQKFTLSKMLDFFLKNDKMATILLINYSNPELYTSLFLEGNDIVDLVERKKTNSNIVYGGTGVLNKRIFDLLIEKKDKHMETDLFMKLIRINQIKGFFNYGKYQHMPDLYDPNYRERRKKLLKDYKR